jgi:hypothetical protein
MRVLVFLCLLFVGRLKAEVYDCFTFFNEIELLSLRLEELSDVVDRFVLVESPISYSGKTKPLYYHENKHLFEKFNDRIIHIIVQEFPGLVGDPEKDHWYRETYSRDSIMRGLTNCKDHDVIFISDLDEIPRKETVLKIKEYLNQFNDRSERNVNQNDNFLVCGLDMRLFMYFMNRENFQGWYGGSKATPYWMVKRHTPWGIKLYHHKYSMHKIPNAGWHFNTMGGKDLSLQKWLHTGPIYYPGSENALNTLKEKPELLEQSFNGQVNSNTVTVLIDESFPRYFLENLDHFRMIGWIYEN